MISALSKNKFIKNVATLVAGTGLAQLIGILVSPVLTRLYTPTDFGTLALYLSLISVLGVIATGRYEMAIMLPTEDSEPEVGKLLGVIATITIIVSILSLMAVVFFNHDIADLLGNTAISSWLYFVPLGLFLNSIYQSFYYLLIRGKSFKRLATNRIVHSSTNSSFQLVLGVLKVGGIGMLFSNILSYFFTSLLITRDRYVRGTLEKIEFSDIRLVAKKHKQFPLYDVPAVMVNLIANQFPIIALGKVFSLATVGFYSLTFRVLTAPLNLLSNSILDVFKQKATEDYNTYGTCRKIFMNTTKALVLLAAPPFLILGLFAPKLFVFFFGAEWLQAGVFAQLLAPMLFFKFIVSPLTYVFIIYRKQKINLMGQIILLASTLFAFTIGSNYGAEVAILLFSVFYSLIYILYWIISYILSGGRSNEEISHTDN